MRQRFVSQLGRVNARPVLVIVKYEAMLRLAFMPMEHSRQPKKRLSSWLRLIMPCIITMPSNLDALTL